MPAPALPIEDMETELAPGVVQRRANAKIKKRTSSKKGAWIHAIFACIQAPFLLLVEKNRLRAFYGAGHSALCDNVRHLGAVGFGAVDVFDQFQSIGCVAGSGGDSSFVKLFANQRGLNGAGTRGFDRGTGDNNAGGGAGAIGVERDNSRTSGNRVV